MDILCLVAGTNEPSNSNMLADAFIQGMQQENTAHVHKRMLKDMKINHFTVDFYDPECSLEEDFCELQKLMQQSSGLVIATPVWNFGVPAHLKNFIDRMGSFALDETRSRGTLNGLPFYLIFTGGAPYPAWKGLMQKTTSSLPESLKYFGASYMGHHYEGKCTPGKGQFELVVDKRPDSLATLRKEGNAFAEVVQTYHDTGKPPLSKQAQSKVMRLGEAILKKIA